MPVLAAGCAALALAACGSSDPPATAAGPVNVPYAAGAAAASNPVAYWNKVAADTVLVPASATGTIEEQRPNLPVDLATVHVAIYDAVNAIVGTHTRFAAAPTTQAAGASQEAATAAAAVTVLKGLFPTRSAQYQGAYDTYVAALPDGDPKARGLAVGTEVATQVLTLRANDGRATNPPPYVAGTAPGRFRGTNPIGLATPFIKPFTLTSASQFRLPPPPALDSREYAEAFEEVRTLGLGASAVRTAAQTELARFHTENPSAFAARNYRSFAKDDRSIADNARLLAMLWVAQADASIACFESKYHHQFWRPTSAITLADTDGNAATTADPTWTPVVPTPNHPEYPSAHMCVNGASIGAVKAHYGTDQITFSFGSTVTNTVREYSGPKPFLDDIVLARVAGGMHFRFANVQGGVLGENVARWVADNHFRPR